MKKLTLSVLTVLSVLVFSTNLYARDLVIGLSPFHADKAKAKAQVKTVIQFLLHTIEPGEQATIFNAYHLDTIGVFAVPEKSSYRHPKAKLRVNASVVKKLLAFADRAMKPTGDIHPSVSGALRFPHFLVFLGENYSSSQKTDVLVLGSPIFDDPKERGFSMARGHIPGDGNLQLSRRNTPFGIQGQEQLLSNFRIHLASPQGWQRDDHHTFYVKRFWVLWVQGQGGSLVTFTNDLPTAFQKIKVQALAPKHPFKLKKTDSPKLEMILLRPPEVENHTSLYERPVRDSPVSSAVADNLSEVEIGITWDDPDSDLDLYVQHGPQAKPLYYLNTETAEAKYYKDFMNSPRATNGYETVAFTRGIHVQDLIVAINFFGGHVDSQVTGQVRISVNGDTYAQNFVIEAQQGNHGKGREETLLARTPFSPQWIIIDPLEVIGLRTEG